MALAGAVGTRDGAAALADGCIRVRAKAHAAAAVREPTSSVAKILLKCRGTVFTLRPRVLLEFVSCF
ncbi:hypothetical protein GCM10010038_22910 [Glutamicibacter protophormiae]|nr:hypothetical protein GCM10010038_22910 [Glutamicibacter protophormiae]